MDIDTPGGSSPVDLENLIQAYRGHSRINRLVFIAQASVGKPIELEALKLAADDLKSTDSAVEMYELVMQMIDGRLGDAYIPDVAWIETTRRANREQEKKLKHELKQYQNNMMKESIRMAHNDLADFYYNRGGPDNLNEAFRSYVRTRDYCSSNRHTIAMCLNIVRVAIEVQNWVHVLNYAQKALQTPQNDDVIVQAKLRAAEGLALMQMGKYLDAAHVLTSVSPEIGDTFSDVIAAQDIGVYGTLCALASMPRTSLHRCVAESGPFRELVTIPDLREAVQDFHAARYSGALAALARLQPTLELDPHVSRHVRPLMAAIRSRALAQYCKPFAAADLRRMAQVFGTTEDGLQAELEALIEGGQIDARIDVARGVLVERTRDDRAAAYEAALAGSDAMLGSTRALLLRASLVRHDVSVKRPARAGRGHGDGGTPGPPQHVDTEMEGPTGIAAAME
ncbi:unnamed protein product [Pedinophyceae sp. YPF-701]|nr:unnamed protein product [Pedinophyceae sp. YPF-701]